MANVINRITREYLTSVHTPHYPESEWIINPVLPECNPIYYVIEGDTVREMIEVEKIDLVYSTGSSIYLIAEKQLIININGHDYESDLNAIINPHMPECDIKYTKVNNDSIIEMNEEEKYIIDLPDLKREWIDNIVSEIYKSTCVEEVALLGFLVAQGYMSKTNPQVITIKNIIITVLESYPKPT